MAALPGYRAPADTQLGMVVTFYPPDWRSRDDDNAIASFKAGRDGIALAIRTDDRWFRPRYQFGEPVNGGAVIVVLDEKPEAFGTIAKRVVARIAEGMDQ